MKSYLASWLLSAETATNMRASKAIGGRFYDDAFIIFVRQITVSDGSID